MKAAATEINQASLEDLMEMEISSVNRRPQKMSQAAAAIYVITREDILRFGASSIPEALRMAPGVQVAQIDGSKWAITARGFNGRFANKLLVLVDGRSVYTNLFSGVYWDQNDVMIEDVERIEVIRGPGATTWGSNAVNGVINIITRATTQTQGGLASVSSATDKPGSLSARYGARLGDKITYRSFVKGFDYDDQALAGGQPAHDAWYSLRAGGRVEYERSPREKFIFQGDLYKGHSSELLNTGIFIPNSLPPIRSGVSFQGGYAQARWERHISERSETALEVYFNEERRSEVFGAARVGILDVNFQHQIHFGGRNDLVWGAEGRFSWDDAPTKDPSWGIAFDPAKRNVNLFAASIQDDFALVKDRLVVSLGTKFQASAYGGPQLQPRFQILWTPRKHQTYWAAISHAVRTPSEFDQDIRLTFAFPTPSPFPVVAKPSGNPAFQAERMTSYETGFRHQLLRSFSTDVAFFFSDYNGLSIYDQGQIYFDNTASPQIVIPFLTKNLGSAETKGIEIGATWTPTAHWKLAGNYSFLHMSQGGVLTPTVPTLDDPTRSPTHQWHLRSSWQVTRRVTWDSALYSVAALPGPGIPAYTRLDTQLGWRFHERMELSAGAKNLLDPRHPEFVSENYPNNSQVRRSAYLRLMWAF